MIFRITRSVSRIPWEASTPTWRMVSSTSVPKMPWPGWKLLPSKAMSQPSSPQPTPMAILLAQLAFAPNGADNAAILAVQMLALSDDELAQKLDDFKAEMAAEVEAKDAKVRAQFA